MKAQIVFLFKYLKVAYYSVQKVDDKLSPLGDNEFADFQKRMSIDSKDIGQLSELHRMISEIGNDELGAIDDYFKRENSFERLPPYDYKFFDSDGITDFGLRLYCIRVTNEVVILLNGDRKTTQKTKDCLKCRPHFNFANQICQAFYGAKYLKDIEIEGQDILTEEDYFLEI